MLRWFVTGAGGQLATAFERELEGEVFLSREAALDIRDADALGAAVRAFKPDVVLHTAAFTDVDAAETDEVTCWAINVEGTRNVLQAVKGTHTAVVYFSTDYVFDGELGRPYVESDPTGPINVYGRSKLAGEELVLEWVHGMVVRTAWLVSETGRNFVKTVLAAARQKAAAGEPLKVVDDQTGSPTFAGHLAGAVDEALRIGVSPGLYHMAGGGFCTWYEVAREIVALAGIDVAVEPIATAELGRPARRPPFSALSSERPIPQLPNWADGVAEAVDRLILLG